MHERCEDAPFMGALICAVDCDLGCEECFNQHLKTNVIKSDTVDLVLRQVKNNQFNQGIIFGGLEWSLQIEEAVELADKAFNIGLYTMLYTGRDCLPMCIIQHFDYIKCGRYIRELSCNNNTQYGIKLATSNQRILKRGIDY